MIIAGVGRYADEAKIRSGDKPKCRRGEFDKGLERGPVGIMIVANASYKGGVGKSTVTAALASALALKGARVLVADADQNETLKQWSLDFELPATLRVE